MPLQDQWNEKLYSEIFNSITASRQIFKLDPDRATAQLNQTFQVLLSKSDTHIEQECFITNTDDINEWDNSSLDSWSNESEKNEVSDITDTCEGSSYTETVVKSHHGDNTIPKNISEINLYKAAPDNLFHLDLGTCGKKKDHHPSFINEEEYEEVNISKSICLTSNHLENNETPPSLTEKKCIIHIPEVKPKCSELTCCSYHDWKNNNMTNVPKGDPFHLSHNSINNATSSLTVSKDAIRHMTEFQCPPDPSLFHSSSQIKNYCNGTQHRSHPSGCVLSSGTSFISTDLPEIQLPYSTNQHSFKESMIKDQITLIDKEMTLPPSIILQLQNKSTLSSEELACLSAYCWGCYHSQQLQYHLTQQRSWVTVMKQFHKKSTILNETSS